MASIQTGIELNDRFSMVLNSIVSSVYLATSAMYDMQQSMNADIDTSGLEGARNELNQAAAALHALDEVMGSQTVPAVTAYEEMAQRVSETGQRISDNTNRQEGFNQTVQAGTQQANGMVNMIKNAVMAYASIQSIGKVLEISDDLVQTMARLNIMNDGLQSTQELVNMVYAAAQDARGSFSDMADVVARFGNNAGNAFSSSEEVVAFANLIQKQMTIAGASTQEASNAMIQLSQGLAAGALRGEELNSILDQAPTIARTIESAMGWAEGSIKSYAEQGLVTADVVKNAILGSADEINAKFESMPLTWAQATAMMQNAALKAFQPVLQYINQLANNEGFQMMADRVVELMATVANVVLDIFDLVAAVGTFIADNWSVISPIIYGVIVVLGAYLAISVIVAAINGAVAVSNTVKAASEMMATGATLAQTAAQYGLNAALAACPLTWIILLIIALIAVIFAVCNAIAKMTGVTSSGFGLICGIVAVAVSYILNLFIGMINTVVVWLVNLYNMGANFAAAFGVLFNDPVAAIKAVMLSLFNFIVSIVSKAAAMLDALFGSNLAGAVSQFQGKIQAEIDATIENAGGKKAELLNPADYMLDQINYGDAFNAGASWGDGIAESVGNFSLADIFGSVDMPNVAEYTSGFGDYSMGLDNALANSGIGDNLGGIAGDTGAIRDTLDVTQEDLKYLRDIAEQEAVNRYTVAEIHIDQSGMQNVINSGDDIDGFMTKLTDSVNEAVDNMTEGVHE